jgi:hypothetical protein
MPMIPASSRRRFTPALSRAPALLATTSVAALLMAASAQAGQTITNQNVATVTNPAGNNTTSIVITNSTVTGAVSNAGTIPVHAQGRHGWPGLILGTSPRTAMTA